MSAAVSGPGNGAAGERDARRGRPGALPAGGVTFGWSLARTLGFTGLYVAATYAGRLTVMDQTNLSLVWPAAGVAAVWFVAQRASRWRWLDVLALSAVTMVVNTATGAPAMMAAGFVVANLVQALVFAGLFRRWLPELWGGGGHEPISRLRHLWRLLAVAAVSTTCGAAIGPTAVWLNSGVYSAPATAVWLTRNSASMLLIGVAGLRIGHLLHAYWTGNVTAAARTAALRQAWSSTPVPRLVEYATISVVSVATYGAAFGIDHGLPLAFPLIVPTVWVALRLHTSFVIAHDLAFGSLAVVFTLHGDGPFAGIISHPVRALVVQLFVGVVSVVGLAVALGRDERAALMDAMRKAERAAAEQATLLRTIVDSMSEGLAVIDDQGRFLLRNPAAGRLLGGIVSTTGRMAGNDFHGLHHPDGTPMPADELPYRRALATGRPHSMDIVVRNAAVPEGRTLNVNATPLSEPVNGIRYAVSIFSDVTAERRHRDELADFAGVVAHDLANPLATIEGWGEELADTVHVAPHRAADGVARINRAAARMRHLITDLLTYTTARDATLQPASVDLTAMVTDIAAARADQAQSTGTPVPRIDIADLGPVDADPVLVRRLLDNLISNSIKYTGPGVVPHIRITSRHDGGRIRVEVTDNGIGIPAGQHHAVFDNFHRAHRTAGYTGTGLGLGICKRIVERHGGTITASDDFTGTGTRIAFTLPAHDAAHRADTTTRIPGRAGGR